MKKKLETIEKVGKTLGIEDLLDYITVSHNKANYIRLLDSMSVKDQIRLAKSFIVRSKEANDKKDRELAYDYGIVALENLEEKEIRLCKKLAKVK